MKKIAVILHLFHEDLIHEVTGYLANIPYIYDLFVTVRPGVHVQVYEVFSNTVPGMVCIETVENRGRDIAPFLHVYTKIYRNYDLICKIHSKKTLHKPALGCIWRKKLYDDLLGSEHRVTGIIEQFRLDECLGVIYPSYKTIKNKNIKWGKNYREGKRLGGKMGIKIVKNKALDFPAGSMFWFRPDALLPLLDLNLVPEDFLAEKGQKDRTSAHAIERLFLKVAEHKMYSALQILSEESN
jgi:lipopolysaccharide biosynthesis protein